MCSTWVLGWLVQDATASGCIEGACYLTVETSASASSGLRPGVSEGPPSILSCPPLVMIFEDPPGSPRSLRKPWNCTHTTFSKIQMCKWVPKVWWFHLRSAAIKARDDILPQKEDLHQDSDSQQRDQEKGKSDLWRLAPRGTSYSKIQGKLFSEKLQPGVSAARWIQGVYEAKHNRTGARRTRCTLCYLLPAICLQAGLFMSQSTQLGNIHPECVSTSALKFQSKAETQIDKS